ncbi:molybdopterin-dependent oxidoreductase [Actinacidiphila guanduensis]|jgi:DMSO/TMAO reductase YedYZ molybdopterin-dependent catalytic subunit|uniref:DMSO/TMAO reductase YedYZ, molybdopterin-dependent catalytic subunit n=1 Tax=Actinacidiphila guanduensis TaxID=310781 RepID=A0A1H0DKC6_9ACTN|nr:molybdopterin-dependent oxidoreductase [Actinacidiphila guanduensis]SDN70707.1 DMSO/TMAO reductase YedYZ, molybdopterin-dependent catalytic subunit [Actinacidiphila guanduensis]
MGRDEHREEGLPPGQRPQRGWPVTHYGPVPRFRPDRWDFRVFGATADGGRTAWNHEEFSALPYATVIADFHCVTRFSMRGMEWGGIAAATVAKLAPPADDVTHVMVWAEYGFSANLRLSDFLDPQTVFATHESGQPLTAEHGFPARLVVPHLYAWKGPKWVRGIEYMTTDRRGFWEERGYHNLADPWQEQRFTYQESPGDGPEL